MTVLATRDGLELDDDPARIDADRTYELVVGQGYWALDRSREVVAASIGASWCMAVYDGGTQVAFARAVTDRLTFAWICDVVVDEAYRGRGIGHWLVATLTDAVAATGVGWQILRTRDAHGLYRDLGFTELTETDRWMERRAVAAPAATHAG